MNYPKVEELLPHSGDMIYLSRVNSCGPNFLSALVIPEKNSPLDTHGLIPVWAGIEYVSQAIAAHAALTNSKNNAPKIGYLVSVRKLECNVSHFEQGQELTVTVETEATDGDFATFTGFITSADGTRLMNGRFSVYHSEASAEV